MSLIDNLIVNLRIISKIQENGKISTVSSGQISLQRDSATTSFWRTITGDSREKTVAFLVQLMDDVTEVTDNILCSKYMIDYDPTNMYQINERNKRIDQLTNLSRQLQNSKKGVVNLYTTYKKDATNSSKIEGVIEKIDSQVIKIERSLTMLKEQMDKNSNNNKNW